MRYKDYERMIMKRAHLFSRNRCVDFSDLVSVGIDSFLDAKRKYDPARGRFSSFFYTKLTNDMLNYIKRKGWEMTNRKEIEMEFKLFTEITPRDILEARDDLMDMDEKARFVVETILDNPEKFGIKGTESPCKIRVKIKKTLRNTYHWKYRDIWNTLRRLEHEYSNKN